MPRLSVNGNSLHYQITGQGQPLVFIHGLGSSTRDWQAQVDHFSTSYRVITLDLRGHGESDKPRGRYSIELFAKDVGQILQLPGNSPAHVVGLSLGGMVAFELAASRPDLIRSLVIVNSGPEMPRDKWRDRVGVLQLLLVRWLIVRVRGMRKLGEALGDKLFPEAGQEAMRSRFIQRWAENDRRAYLSSMWSLRRWSVAARLGDIDCPTCIMSAEMDYTPLSYKEAYASKLPRAEVVSIAGSRHLTPVDQPEGFNEALASFLAKSE